MTIYVRQPNPIWFFNNLVGQPVDDTYYAFFLTNDLPYIPQAVYQDPNGVNPWSDPIEFAANAGLPNNLYFDTNLTYRIEVRQGPTDNDALIYLIENFSISAGSGSSGTSLDVSNLITNSQFADIYFQPAGSITFTVAGTYDIAPGWQLVLTGTGTTTVTQHTNDGASNVAGNPPYYITFANLGWTTATLVETFNNNGAIFSGGSIAVSLLAFATTTAQEVTVNYVPSTGTATLLLDKTVLTGGFATYTDFATIPTSTNTDVGTTANVKIQIAMPGSSTLSFTNIQLVGQSTPFTSSTLPSFQQLTYERIVDEEFHVYRNSLVTEPKSTILTGWNFATNPWQFTSTTPANVPVNQYTADQTIIIQQAYVSGAIQNNVSVGQDSLANNYGLKVTAVTAHNEFAILQYIDAATIRPYWGRKLSSIVRAAITTTHATSLQFKMRLIYKAGLPGTLAQADPIASWTENGTPVAAAGYALVAPAIDSVYTLTSTPTDFSFNGFQLPTSTNASMTLGVLLYTSSNMNQTATADFITINDVSLVDNDFSIETQPKTWDQTLKECQYYYEQSYTSAAAIGTATSIGVRYASNPLGGDYSSTVLYKNTFQIQYNNVKRAAATVKMYAIAIINSVAIADHVQMGIMNGNLGSNNGYPAVSGGVFNPINISHNGSAPGGSWSVVDNSTKEIVFRPADNSSIMSIATSPASDQGEIYYHFTADSRLGV